MGQVGQVEASKSGECEGASFVHFKILFGIYLAALTIDDPYDWPLQVGNANGLMAAKGDGTIPLIPVWVNKASLSKKGKKSVQLEMAHH